jgi:serine/threonine-protein kinase
LLPVSTSSGSVAVGLRIALAIALAVVLVVAAVIGAAQWLSGGDEVSEPADLGGAVEAQDLLDRQRLRGIDLAARELAADGAVAEFLRNPPASVDPDAPPPARAVLDALLDERELAFALLVGPRGGALLSAGDVDEETASALAASRTVARAEADGSAVAPVALGDELFLVAGRRVERSFDALGTVVVAEVMTGSLVVEASRIGGAETAYLSVPDGGEPRLMASTLGDAEGRDLVAAAAGAGLLEGLGQRPFSGPETVSLDGSSYQAVGAAVGASAAPGGDATVARVTLLPRREAVASVPLRTVQMAALGAGLLGLLVALALAPLLARSAGAPGRRLAKASEAARRGDYGGALTALGRSGPRPFAALVHDVAGREAVAETVAAASRSLPVPGAGEGAGEAPARRKAHVLLVDLARYGRLGLDDDPREIAAHLERDRSRVRQAVSAHCGRVEGALGHRLLASFDDGVHGDGGDDSAPRALAAGAEVLERLSVPENAFDEPIPPAVAVAPGSAILGGPASRRTVAGLSVQMADSLLREAAPGDLVLPAKLVRRFADRLEAAGVEVSSQNSFLSPQPVYVLDGAAARRVADVLAAEGGAVDAGLAALAPGSRVADRFELAENLGASALGPVGARFRAVDVQSDRPVALAALARSRIAALDALEGFGSELHALTRVSHPRLAQVVDLGVDEAGVPYLAEELARGVSLEAALATPEADRGLPEAAARRVGAQLAEALAALHAGGYAHGALAPERVVLEPRGDARVTGAGVALLLPTPGIDAVADRALGPSAWLAPERLGGGGPTPAADVWSAGALLVALHTGRPPFGFGGGAAEEIRSRALAGVADGALDGVPADLVDVVRRCLAPEPGDRYASAVELAAALDRTS